MILNNTGNEIFIAFKEALATLVRKVVIVTHENPDGDAIGSAIGLGEVLKNYGHDVTILVPNAYPDFLKFFSSEIQIVVYERKQAQSKRLLDESDLLVCVDFNEPKRTARL